MTPTRRSFTHWKSGRFALHLVGGQTVNVSGRIRFERNAEFFCDYELESDSLAMQPDFTQIVAIENLPDAAAEPKERA